MNADNPLRFPLDNDTCKDTLDFPLYGCRRGLIDSDYGPDDLVCPRRRKKHPKLLKISGIWEI